MDTDVVYLRYDTQIDRAPGWQVPRLLTVHKTLEGAIDAITPCFRDKVKTPTGSYIRDFTHEAIQKANLRP